MIQLPCFIKKIGYSKTPIEYLKQKNGVLQVSMAAVLLYGTEPQKFFRRARIRFIRYEDVDRMCREPEAAGQKNQEYYPNAFMLQTIIFNDKNQDNEKVFYTYKRKVYFCLFHGGDLS